jgi:hypothetical protein
MFVEESLTLILRRIVEGSLVPAAYFVGLDSDAALDAREQDKEFVASWVRLSDELECRWAKITVSEELRTLAEETRRESFLAVSRATQQHEIASYVSDDLDLIVRAQIIGLTDPLLDQLWHAYDAGEFPQPEKSV